VPSGSIFLIRCGPLLPLRPPNSHPCSRCALPPPTHYLGVRGTVQGPSGPLQATLHIKPVNNTAFVPFYSAKATGFYARPLQPGVNYTIVCQAAGFKAQEAAFVVPADGIATVDFTLAAGR
jgi:hypothetical protein